MSNARQNVIDFVFKNEFITKPEIKEKFTSLLDEAINESKPKVDDLSVDSIKNLGFDLDKEYDHDEFTTHRYVNGPMMIEFTYLGDEIQTVDMVIDEVYKPTVNMDFLPMLVKYFNQDSVTSELEFVPDLPECDKH